MGRQPFCGLQWTAWRARHSPWHGEADGGQRRHCATFLPTAFCRLYRYVEFSYVELRHEQPQSSKIILLSPMSCSEGICPRELLLLLAVVTAAGLGTSQLHGATASRKTFHSQYPR